MSTLTHFVARAVAAQMIFENVYGVVLAERGDAAGARLEVQLAKAFDEHDAALGQDTYCLSTGDAERHYGGVVSYGLDGSTLEVTLDDRAATALGTPGFRIELAVPRETIERIMRGLERALGFPPT